MIGEPVFHNHWPLTLSSELFDQVSKILKHPKEDMKQTDRWLQTLFKTQNQHIGEEWLAQVTCMQAPIRPK